VTIARRLRSVLPASLLCLSVLSCDVSLAETKTEARPPGHQRMLSVLADIARRAAADEDKPVLGPRKLEKMRELIQHDAGPAGDRIDHLKLLALLELGEGENARTRDVLARAEALVDELPEGQRRAVRAELLFWQGVEAMRDGENRNCVAHHSSDSCLVPLRQGGVHED